MMRRLLSVSMLAALVGFAASLVLSRASFAQMRGPCTMNGAAGGGCGADCYRGCMGGQVNDDTCDNTVMFYCYLTQGSCGMKVDPNTCQVVPPWVWCGQNYNDCHHNYP